MNKKPKKKTEKKKYEAEKKLVEMNEPMRFRRVHPEHTPRVE